MQTLFFTSYLETNFINNVFTRISHWRGRITVNGKHKVFSSFFHCVQFLIKLSVPIQLFLELINHQDGPHDEEETHLLVGPHYAVQQVVLAVLTVWF